MKNKKLICLLLSAVLIFSAVMSVGFTAFAGDVSFEYDTSSATLTIKGSGDMDDYTESTLKNRPWNVYKDETKHIVVSDGITSIGAYALAQFAYAADVTLPDSVASIGTAAFAGLDSLKELTVPDSVQTIGDYAFGYDGNMDVPQDFVVHCSTKSASQEFCFKNGIAFDSPMQSMQTSAHITKSDELQLWSFVPTVDGTITFYSTGKKNTVGFLFDAQNYVYSTNYGELKKTALKFDEWSGEGLNFKFSCDLTAGKRYYLGARFRTNSDYDGSSATEDGRFDVVASFACKEHKYAVTNTVEPTCTDFGYETYTCIGCGTSYKESVMPLGHELEPNGIDGDNVTLKCVRCDETSTAPFMDYYHTAVTDENRKFDVNSDGVINAKDYAILYKK